MTEKPARTMREYNAERRTRQCSPACSEQHTYTPPCELAPAETQKEGEEAGPTPAGTVDKPDGLREQYAAAIDEAIWSADNGSFHQVDVDQIRTAVLGVRDTELQQLREQLARAEQDLAAYAAADSADAAAGSYAGRAEQAEAELQRLRTESPWLRATAEDLAEANAAIARGRELADEYAASDPKWRPLAIHTARVLHAALNPRQGECRRCHCPAGAPDCTHCNCCDVPNQPQPPAA